MKFIVSLAVSLSIFLVHAGYAQDAGSPPKSCSRIEDRRLKGQCMAENAKQEAIRAKAEVNVEEKSAIRNVRPHQQAPVPCPRSDDRKANAQCRARNAKIQQDFIAKHAKPEPFVDTSDTAIMSCSRLDDAKMKAKCLQKQYASQ